MAMVMPRSRPVHRSPRQQPSQPGHYDDEGDYDDEDEVEENDDACAVFDHDRRLH